MAVKEREATKTGFVLDSLEKKNVRVFRHLTMEKLGWVNLITGKNNVGKTPLLEALWSYANNGQPFALFELLFGGKELSRQRITNRQVDGL